MLRDDNVIPPTGNAFEISEFGQTTKWHRDQLIVTFAFWNTALQAQQLELYLRWRSKTRCDL